MKKIEFIWRHLLVECLTHRQTFFRQQSLASDFHLSSSTVHLALQPLRELGAIQVGGRGFATLDFEKILYHWANHRRLDSDIHHRLSVNLPLFEIEGLLPDQTLPTTYTAVHELFKEPPADYQKVYCYHPQPQLVLDRFQPHLTSGPPNLFILQSDPHLQRYGDQISLPQLLADLWSLPDWYAKDFVKLVHAKIHELLP